MATLVLFETMGGFKLEGPEAALLGQRVENEFLGVNSGIMDQFIARMGRKDHALFLDCRTHAFDRVPVAFSGARFLIVNTGVSRGLSASKYNERVAECCQAVEAMKAAGRGDGTHLRDFSLDDLLAREGRMPDVPFRRARHVITEDDRTRAACHAMRTGDAQSLGSLMNASDESLRVDYEVTCPELDAMTAIARELSGCYGARMTGAGFGGCTVNLVATNQAESFSDRLLEEYKSRTGLEGNVIVSSPADGAGVVPNACTDRGKN